MEKLIHIPPESVVAKAEVAESIEINQEKVFCVRDFENNFDRSDVSRDIFELTGYSSETIHQITEDSLKFIKRGDVFTGYGGDKFILDPELKQIKDGNIEFMTVSKFNLDESQGESALVRMWQYGALKQLVLPENNPGKQVSWEMMMSLKDKLTVVIPKETESVNGVLVAKDRGVKIELNPGDAIFLPLIPRQVISSLTSRGTKYFNLGPAWEGETGANQKPVYWPDQVK